LVSSFLLSDSPHPLEDEIGKIVPEDAKFSGFNLLLLAPSSSSSQQRQQPLRFDAALVTNHGFCGTLTSRPLSSEERGCGAISNGIDGAGGSEWPKVKHVTQDFASALQSMPRDATEAELVDRLFNVLAREPSEPVKGPSHLRNAVHVSPALISLGGPANPTPDLYATRISTVLLIRNNGEALFIERDIWQLQEGRVVKAPTNSERTFRFQLQLEVE